MPRRPNQPEGLKDMTRKFNIFEKGDGANSYDCKADRGPLKYVPRDPRYFVQQFGGSPTPSGGISAEARADFTNGRVRNVGREISSKPTPETQLPGSINATPGDNGGEVKRSAVR